MAKAGSDVYGPWHRSLTARLRVQTMEGVIKEDHAALARLCAESDTLEEGKLKGYVLTLAVGDGYTYYRVENVSPLVLQHIPVTGSYKLGVQQLRQISLRSVQEYQIGEVKIRHLFKRGERA